MLSLFAAIINKLKTLMDNDVPHIFEAAFECTLQMITRNFEDYPEHRLQFFALLHAIVNHCFRCAGGWGSVGEVTIKGVAKSNSGLTGAPPAVLCAAARHRQPLLQVRGGVGKCGED